MYLLGWTGLVAITLWISVLAFVWGAQSGQFSDQGRARYLPLSGEPMGPPIDPANKMPPEAYALMAIAAIGMVAFLMPVLITVYRILKGLAI